MLHSLRWRIAIPYVILSLTTMLALTAIVTNQVRAAQLSAIENQLTAQARLIADALANQVTTETAVGALDEAAQHWAALTGARVTIVRRDGTAVGESSSASQQLENHGDRPEVRQALAGAISRSTRLSSTTNTTTMYVAAPIASGSEVAAVARVALPLDQVQTSVDRLQRTILMAGVVIALLVMGMALVIADRTARPVRRLTAVASRIAEGDFDARLQPTSKDELGQLTQAFNQMATELQDKLGTLAEERSRLAAILENMADGVIITAATGQVELINPAAARMLDTAVASALDRPFAAVVRHHEIIDLWQKCRAQQAMQAGELEIQRRDIYWQVIVAPFAEVSGQGYLVIMQDLSRIRRLETVRRDFVSNISHELRTPLASLKALTDTLRDGALDDPPAAARFLNRMDTELDALTQMVQELLELSRIESGQVSLRLAPATVADIVRPPVERLKEQAEREGLTLTVELTERLPAVWADVERIQQVVTNLVHNAIKFTPSGGRIVVRAEVGQDSQIPATSRPTLPRVSGRWPVVIISVSDTGVGIPARDLLRIFERFYKADRARGRGGTGLGLAIARHLVQSHGGAIWVESEEGVGSTFFFSLPVAEIPATRLTFAV